MEIFPFSFCVGIKPHVQISNFCHFQLTAVKFLEYMLDQNKPARSEFY